MIIKLKILNKFLSIYYSYVIYKYYFILKFDKIKKNKK